MQRSLQIRFAAVLAIVIVTGYPRAYGGNLLTNGDFEAGNTGFTSNYAFVPGNLGDQGTYDVAANTHAENIGFNAIGDHTSGSGAMLIVNGIAAIIDLPHGVAQRFFWEETVPITPNSIYTFSGFMHDLDNTNHATIAFIELQGGPFPIFHGAFGPLPDDAPWTPFSFQGTAGSGGSITLALFDLRGDFGGNDFAIDDLSLVAGTQPPGGGTQPSDGTAVPEPGAMVLTAAGLAGLIGVRHRRRLRDTRKPMRH